MKTRGFRRGVSLMVAAALLLCGCSGGDNVDGDHDEDIDLVGDISEETTTTTSAAATTKPPELPNSDNISWFTAFIMPEKPLSSYKFALGEKNCVPGYMYLKGSGNAVYPLLNMHFRDDLEVFQSDTHAYAVSDEGGSRLLKIDKLTGEYEVLYEAENGVIDVFSRLRRGDNAGRIYYLSDGSRIVRILRDTDQAEVIAESESGIAFADTPEYAEQRRKNDPSPNYYICEECSEKGDYVFWGDNDGNVYWYHCHTGENMLLDDSDMWELKTYASDSEVPGDRMLLSDLYFRNIYTGEEIFITEDAHNYSVIDDTVLIEVEKGDGAPYIMAAHIPERKTEIVYTPQYGDIEIVLDGYRVTELDEFRLSFSDHVLMIKDGDYLVKMDAETMEVTTLFRLDNGMFSSPHSQIISEREFYWIHSADYALNELELLEYYYDEWLAEDYPDMDLSSFYYCEDCIDDPCAFYWKDGNGDCWWYHAHSGENEPINVDESSYWIGGSWAHFITRKNQ